MLGSTFAESSNVPLMREGTTIVQATASLIKQDSNLPIRLEIQGENQVDSLIVLPNQRLQEMESVIEHDPHALFSAIGQVYTYGNENYILLREVLQLTDFAIRNHPEFVPIDPNAESLPENASDHSVADIVRELEEAVGPLVRSIRGATENPKDLNGVQKEGTRIQSRRCHIVRNDAGAWVAVFGSDAYGLRDPPATVLPSRQFQSLTNWISTQNMSTPVLLTGELMLYHGHSFLLLKSWRRVHNTSHIE